MFSFGMRLEVYCSRRIKLSNCRPALPRGTHRKASRKASNFHYISAVDQSIARHMHTHLFIFVSGRKLVHSQATEQFWHGLLNTQ